VPVTVTAGVVTRAVNANMVLGGTVAGTVHTATGAPVVNACVEAHDSQTYDLVGESAPTSITGTYTILGLSTSAVRLMTRSCGHSDPEVTINWHPNAASLPTAADVQVGSGLMLTGIDIALDPAGSISGTVSDLDGNPAEACAFAYPTDSDPAEGFPYLLVRGTFGQGGYKLTNLPAGYYKVLFGPCFPGFDVVPEWYGDSASFATAAVVRVGLDQDVKGIDATVALA
jgi:hypothetical protein